MPQCTKGRWFAPLVGLRFGYCAEFYASLLDPKDRKRLEIKRSAHEITQSIYDYYVLKYSGERVAEVQIILSGRTTLQLQVQWTRSVWSSWLPVQT